MAGQQDIMATVPSQILDLSPIRGIVSKPLYVVGALSGIAPVRPRSNGTFLSAYPA